MKISIDYSHLFLTDNFNGFILLNDLKSWLFERRLMVFIMKDQICMVTGSNSGIGKAVAQELAEMNAKVILVCRDATKGKEEVEEIKSSSGNSAVELMVADLASMDSVRKLAKNF